MSSPPSGDWGALVGVITVCGLFAFLCGGGCVMSCCGGRRPDCSQISGSSFLGAIIGAIASIPCLCGYEMGLCCSSAQACDDTCVVILVALCSIPGKVAVHLEEGYQDWMGSFGPNPEAALEHLKKSGRIMLVGSFLSLICMIVAMSSPWALVADPANGANSFSLYVYYGASLHTEFQNTIYRGFLVPHDVSLAVESLVTVSGISYAVLILSLVTQLLAFAATVRTWAALNRWAGAIRVCAREASTQLNAVTFLMMIFCVCTYLRAFQGVTKALGASNSPSNSLQPGFGFAFAAALLSLLSLLMVAGIGFRKAWRESVAGDVGVAAPLIVANATSLSYLSSAAAASASTGADKPLPRHLVRELLEVAEGKEAECPVCLDKITAATGQYTACGHLFCKTCIEELVKEKGQGAARCPTCRASIY